MLALLLIAQITGSGTIFYGINLPATCSKGDVFSSYTLGILASCTAQNTWTTVSTFDGIYASLTGKPTLGTAAATDSTAYATASQGTKADTALQPAGNGSALTGLTKAQVGLSNVDNTSDANKPISSATQTALNGKQASGTYATGTGTASGTNTGDQTITLTGGVTGSGTGSFAATVVTNANLTGAVTSVGNATSYATAVPFSLGGDSACAATSATTGTMTVSMVNSCITITPTGACTFNASGGVAGQIVSFLITTSGVSSFTLTLSLIHI